MGNALNAMDATTAMTAGSPARISVLKWGQRVGLRWTVRQPHFAHGPREIQYSLKFGWWMWRRP